MTRATTQPPPRHVEMWGILVEHARTWRRMAAFSLVFSFLALALAAWCVRAAYFEPVAYQVAPDGAAAYAGRLRQTSGPSEPEARYLAKHFLRRYLSFNSLTVESDWADAWNLMTDALRAEVRAMWDRYQKEHGADFLGHVKEQGIQTELEFDDARTQVLGHNGKSFTVTLRGRMKTWPLSRVGDDTAVLEKDLHAIVTLVTCPRTEATPNGLLVAKVVTRTFLPGEAPPADRVPNQESPNQESPNQESRP